jgi:hypothetical protein
MPIGNFAGHIAVLAISSAAATTGCASPKVAPEVPPRALQARATSDAARLAHGWLRSRIRPSGLAASFEAKGEDDLCVTYDQAVAVDAFLLMADVESARRVLEAMQGLQLPDGSWWTMVRCSDASIFEWNRTVGQTVWMSLAVAKYEQLTGDVATYHDMGKRAIDWAFTFQAADGGINGGIEGGHLARYAGTEFNEDVYAAAAYFGGHEAQTRRVREFIDDRCWLADHFGAGRGDARDPLDVNAWGVQSLGPSGPHPYASALDYNFAHHRFTLDGIDAFGFNSHKDDIWLEGTGEMVLSLKLVGRAGEAHHFFEELVKAQRPNGGVPYSLRGTFNDYWTMTTAPCISSTGWLIISEAGDNPFRFR